MSGSYQQPPQRVSPIHAPDEYTLPGRPEGAASDAYRQTQFLLGSDVGLFEEAMNLQLQLARDAYPSRYRSHALAAVMGLWSRSVFYLKDALLLITRGSYPSTLPIIRTACETIAAEQGLIAGEMSEHDNWLLATLFPNEEFKATEFQLGRYFAGGVIARDDVLGRVFRPAGDLARPHFGATLLQVGPESNNNRLAILFADASFHLGWAELVLGWLLSLSLRQLQVIVESEPMFPVSDEARAAYESLGKRIGTALARDDRCRLTEVDDHGDRRYLVTNFRRASSAVPRKVIL